MSAFKAKPIVKNKLWILEDDTQQIGSIVAGPKGTVSLISGDKKQNFPSFKLLKEKYNIKVDGKKKKGNNDAHTIYGYPVNSKAYNQLYDVKRKLPVFTKKDKSKSYYCAGYYAINLDGEWTVELCPKLLVINRNKHIGPFKTKEECIQSMLA